MNAGCFSQQWDWWAALSLSVNEVCSGITDFTLILWFPAEQPLRARGAMIRNRDHPSALESEIPRANGESLFFLRPS